MPAKTVQKRGRPRIGRKGYCIRLLPEAHKHLEDIAKRSKKVRLGDWLELIAETRGAPLTDDEGCSNLSELSCRLSCAVGEIVAFTEIIEEIVELEASMVTRDEVRKALLRLAGPCQYLFSMLKSEGLVKSSGRERRDGK